MKFLALAFLSIIGNASLIFWGMVYHDLKAFDMASGSLFFLCLIPSICVIWVALDAASHKTHQQAPQAHGGTINHRVVYVEQDNKPQQRGH